ncbi:MAG: D-2-hydroxyacid dehydrogenase, partial [Bacteroidota bacterium]|nr:D-2-hydroxyacid dehydrogenase [Bacteroidota bacterium]
MNIVVLDGHPANPGDLTWEPLEEYGHLTVYPRTPVDKVVEYAKDAEIVLLNKVNMTKEVIAKLPKLKYIGVLATGYNVIDIRFAHERGIVVSNIPAYSTDSVVQMTFAHILNITNQVGHYA